MNKIMMALAVSLITVASSACCNCKCAETNKDQQAVTCTIQGCKCGCHGGAQCTIENCSCVCHKKVTCTCSCCKCACSCSCCKCGCECCRSGHRPPPPRDFNVLPPNGVCNVTFSFGGGRPPMPPPQFQQQPMQQYQQPAPQPQMTQQTTQYPPVQQVTQTWIEGRFVDAVTRDGKLVKTFVPGHYEECMIIGQ